MRRHARLFLALVAAALPLSACGTSPTPPPSAKPAAVPAPSQTATATKSATSTTQPQTAAATTATTPAPIKYEAKGRRDPFAPLAAQEGSKTATIAAAKLRGVVHGRSGILALVDTAEGIGYIVKQGDTLVDGRVVEISQDSVVFAVAPRPGASTNRVILRLPTE
jgi:Tfp pilus assembly protein PilP